MTHEGFLGAGPASNPAAEALTRFPVDRPRPTAGVDATATHRFTLDSPLTSRLRQMAESAGGTLFGALVAAGQVLSAVYAGQDEVTATVGGRSSGNYHAPVLLHATVDGKVPFDRLVGEVCGAAHSLPGEFAVADVALRFAEQDGGLLVCVDYHPDVLDAATVERLAVVFRTLVRGVVDHPGRPLSELRLVPDDELRRLLRDWNDTSREFPEHRSVPDIFAEQVRRTPDKPAVLFGDQWLTWAELNERANRLAHRLLAEGVTAESRVGLLLDRSVHAVVSMLAVLKAGGVYVPLHAAYPQDRIRFVLADVGAEVLLTDRAMASRAATDIPVLVVDDPATTAGQPAHDPERLPDARQLAYIMFTSGSTGTPKGVAVTHSDVVALAWDHRWRDAAHRRILFHSPHAFDAATYEVWVPLLTGGEMVIAMDEPTPALVRELIAKHGVTAVFLTSALLRLFAEEAPDCFAGAGTVITGGEVPSAEALARVIAHCPGTVVINAYGPTEATTYALFQELSLEQVRSRVVPIGRPVDNTRLYVLDAWLRPVPVGAPGELYIAGDGLARGYFGRASLTAERFVADPFGTGERLYRTGDVVRWRADGTMDYLRRADNQVKIRGFRIEIGEIEAALAELDGVTDAAVVVHETRGSRHLVAYVVSERGREPDVAAWRDVLSARLPSYEVPSWFIPMDALPLSNTGKVDRRALPAPRADQMSTAEHVEPRTDTERLLARVWVEALGVERVGVTDNFFALGGDSIVAIKIVSRARSHRIRLTGKDLFLTPTIAELAEVATRTNGEPGDAPADGPLVHLTAAETERLAAGGAVEDVYPLTPMQSGMLFDALMTGDTGLHLIQFDLVLDHVDEPELLGRAWRLVTDRLPILRTAVVWADVSGSVQVVRAAATLPVTQHDWRELPGSDRHERWLALRAADRAAGMDLAAAPLARVAIIRLTDTSVRVLWSMHHIVMDGWSGAELLAEVVADYARLRDGGGPEPRPRVPFEHYLRWLDEQDQAVAEAYWRGVLGDFTTPTRLPYDRPAPPDYRPSATEMVEVDIAPELSAQLADVAKRTKLTTGTLVQGAWALLLSRYSGNRDVCFGGTVSGRTPDLAGVDSIIGMLVNTLPVRVRVDGGQDLVSWLAAFQAEQARARDFEAVSLTQARSWSGLSAGDNLFDSIVVFENFPFDERTFAAHGVELSHFDTEVGSGAALGVVVFPGDRITMRLHYDPALFEADSVRRMADYLLTLLAAFPGEPGRTVGELPALSPAEHRVIVDEWTHTAAGYSVEHRMHELVAEQVRLRPDAVAVELDDQRLTYAELDARANHLAHYLIGRGVGSDVLVGIAIERSLDLFVAILGILKAGGAYVPLDPDYPAERLGVTLAETRPPVVLAHEGGIGRFPRTDASIVFLDRDWPVIAGYPATDPEAPGSARDLAYVVYTSGSTGRPKGVMVEHRSLYNTVTAVVGPYGLTPSSRVFQLCSMSFDTGVQDLFTTWAAGATLVVPGPDAARNGAYLVEHMLAGEVTTASIPITVLSSLDVGSLPGMDTVRVGGDVVVPEVAEAWARKHRVINNYGPTEAGVTVSLFEVEQGAGYRSVPLGKPLANTRVHLLDDRLRPVPVGVPGELYVGGVGIARGYVDNRARTAERFVADPFGPPGSRLYRTGDVVRWRPDGTLDFVGRTDDQVKIRGFRVEPGEIESVLLRHDGVAGAAVAVWPDEKGNKRLVAYVVGRSEAQAPTAEELRRHLSAVLPDYMIPTAIVLLERMPLNHNGKLDRSALPAPTRQDGGGVTYVAPRDPTEEALARIWSEVLGIAQVGVEDDFFALGGDSVNSLRIVARMRTAFGVDVTPRDLFEAMTIAALATTIRDRILAQVMEMAVVQS
ncbi:non-ribosomal peptide synthetase [Couchioplanes caeruleus]|uniref:Non-ribosomal peptide synthetase n=2 Tax=Couchioplanes caeruleus TaxID=56438 RepID=A0A1K0GTL0_9ACTN|nr:non-ribosomal peptide synthetase [Couchioplanes caeruleus]OJF15798.1 Non-ribosomal peptide synthetase [Couchioplanes caeruleus subsp. caeruleus]ROP33039.1 amino acid adenylation domain-containing protein [Couchioplanes caeruleus]